MKYLKLFEDIDFTEDWEEEDESPINIKDIKELKLGDRVMCDNMGWGTGAGSSSRTNKEGTVIDVKPITQVGIEFDDNINGHTCYGQGKDEYCWYVGMKHLAVLQTRDYNIRKI